MGGGGLIHDGAGAAVEVAVDLGPLHELAGVDLLLEGLGVHEVVIHAVALLTAGLAGRVAGGEERAWHLAHQPLSQGGLACARGGREDQ